jgi:prepilin-type N-terminal cleavage/methylation domain-containing protein
MVYGPRSTVPSPGFTLIELLAVVTIMGIVLAISVGAFTKMGEAAALKGGMNQVRGMLVLARQTAITRRVPAAFVVLDQNFFDTYGGPFSQAMGHLGGRAYAVVNMQDMVYVRGWTELPRNVFFNNRIEPSNGKYLGANNGENMLIFNESDRTLGQGFYCLAGIPFPTSPGAATTVNVMGIVFYPDGRAKWERVGDPYYHWVILSEGVKDAAGTIIYRANTRSFGVRATHSGSVKMREFQDTGP